MTVQGRRILVVEDEPLMSSLLVEMLCSVGFEVASAMNVVEARQQVESFDPDAVLLDISLGAGPSGLDLGYVLSRSRPDIALIFLTKHPDGGSSGLQVSDLPPGCGFLRKDMVRDTQYLLDAIDAVLADRGTEVHLSGEGSDAFLPLTPKQHEVLRLMALGYTNAAVARLTNAAESSVERWAAGIFKALGIDTKGDINPRVEAVRRFISSAGLPERP